MRKIIFKYETGQCGSEGIEACLVPDDITEDALNEFAWQGAIQHAESYGIYHSDDIAQDEDDEGNEYSSNIEGYWEEYDSEEHDKQRPGGGSFEEDFQRLI